MANIKKSLNACQKTFSVHPEHIMKIRNRYSSPKIFLRMLFRYLKRILYLRTHIVPTKRTLRFIARLGTYPTSDPKTKEWVDSYCNSLILFCLKYIDSAYNSTRLRVLELISTLLNDLPDDFSLSEHVFESVQRKICPVLDDSAASMRSQAILCLSRLQQPLDPSDRITQKFVGMLSGDSNRLVREICLKKIGIAKTTLPDILGRVRDVSEFVRKTSFTVMKEKLDIRSLTISQRNEVFRSGLRDRNSIVREECADLVKNFWLPSCGSIFSFLKLLDVEENEEDALIAMESILSEPEGLKEVPPFPSDLTAEKAFYWRAFCEKYKNEKPVNWGKLDELSVDVETFTQLVETNKENKFILKQLLKICQNFDYKDEASRAIIIRNSEKFLTQFEIDNDLVPLISNISRKVLRSEAKHAKHLMSAILKILEIIEKNVANEDIPDEKRIQFETLGHTRILAIIKDMLRFSALELNLPDILFIKEKLILPSVTKDNPFIRAAAIEALTLYCYFSAEEAQRYIIVMYHVLKNDQEALQLIALKSIIDLLLIHGELANLSADPIIERSDAEVSAPEVGKTIVDSLTAYLGSEDELMMYTAVEGFTKLITLGRVRGVKPISMCILLLFNPNSFEDEPVQQCLSLFFSSFLFLNGENFANNIKLFSKALFPTLKIIFHAPKSSPLSKISADHFADWALSFIPVDKSEIPEQLKEAFKRNLALCGEIRKDVILLILKEILQNEFTDEDDDNEALTFAKIIQKMARHISFWDGEEVTKLLGDIEAHLKANDIDKITRIHLRRALREIRRFNGD